MIISAIDQIPQLPQPALGLLPSVIDSSVTLIAAQGDIPSLSAANGSVYENNGESVLTLPASGAFPARLLNPGEFFSSNGTVYYKVVNKTGFSRQVVSIDSSGNFATASPHGIVNDQAVIPAGFNTPVNFSNGTTYYVTGVTANTFALAVEPEGSALAASALVCGWVNTQATNSYYPADFERPLYTYTFTPESFPVGSSFNFSRIFSFRSVGAQSVAAWSVIMEFGDWQEDDSPAPVGPNIEGYNWRLPALEQQVLVTDLATDHPLGITFTRQADGTIQGSRLLYSKALNLIPGTLPVSNDFALRVRIGQFDIEDNVSPIGYVAYFVEPIP